MIKFLTLNLSFVECLHQITLSACQITARNTRAAAINLRSVFILSISTIICQMLSPRCFRCRKATHNRPIISPGVMSRRCFLQVCDDHPCMEPCTPTANHKSTPMCQLYTRRAGPMLAQIPQLWKHPHPNWKVPVFAQALQDYFFRT